MMPELAKARAAMFDAANRLQRAKSQAARIEANRMLIRAERMRAAARRSLKLAVERMEREAKLEAAE